MNADQGAYHDRFTEEAMKDVDLKAVTFRSPWQIGVADVAERADETDLENAFVYLGRQCM
jgi:hypothetical protein